MHEGLVKPVSSWGCLSRDLHRVVFLDDPFRVRDVICSARHPGIAYGMGRSYGDVCLNPGGALWVTTGLDHFIAFDETTGRLVCEAGVLLRDIQQLTVPRGWILPVTPGTQLVTLGGAIANDVHGKNHHVVGSFGGHIQSLTLVRTTGEVIECGPQERADWFAATVGGLGLTGIITHATIQLRRVAGPWLHTEIIPFTDLTEFFYLSNAFCQEWEYIVSWVDNSRKVMMRGLFMAGKHIMCSEKNGSPQRKMKFPFDLPFSIVNRSFVKLFNHFYYHIKRKTGKQRIVYYENFLYPLDNILQWNRIYGKKGFFQYQCVLPSGVGEFAVRDFFKEISRYEDTSFLCVLKVFGNSHPVGMLSFPQPGITIALDFPNGGEKTCKLFVLLDSIVREAGGRIFMAKDARMPRELFEAGYPRAGEFMKYRDPGMSSALSRRLMGR